METNIKLRLLGLGKSKKVKPLNDEMAMELGAEMLGEGVVFGVAAFTLWLEYKRQQHNENMRETSQFGRISDLEARLMDLDLQLEEQRTHTRELTRLIHSVNDKRHESSLQTDSSTQHMVVTSSEKTLHNTKKYDGLLYTFCVLFVLVYMYQTM